MIYLQQNNQARKIRIRRVATSVSVFFAAIIILIQIIFPHLFSALVTSLIRPFWRAEFSMESGSLRSPQSLLAENERLKIQVAEADLRLRMDGAIKLENTELKSFFGRNTNATSTKNRRTLTPILIRPGVGIYDEFIIDGGKDLGFTVGNKIYAPGDVLIGEISDVLSETSKISLFSSPGNVMDVLIGQSNLPAIAVGRGGGQYTAQLPRAVKISTGDFVIVPSIDDKPFGVVFAVENNPAQSFETILFAPPVNIYQLRWVLVEHI